MAKKKTIDIVRCMDCERAYLMRSSQVNPIVAECSATKERQVANTHFPCERFKQRYDKVEIHPMTRAK